MPEKKKERADFDLSKRKKIVVPIFADEYDDLDLEGDTIFAVQSQVREKLGLPARQRTVISVRRQLNEKLRDLSDDELKEVLEKLED